MTDFNVQDRFETREVPSTKQVGTHCVSRFQMVEDSRGYVYVVVGFTENGLELQDPDFEGPQFEAEDTDGYEPKTVTVPNAKQDGHHVEPREVPVWAY